MPRAQDAQERPVSVLHGTTIVRCDYVQDERYAAGAGRAGAACLSFTPCLEIRRETRLPQGFQPSHGHAFHTALNKTLFWKHLIPILIAVGFIGSNWFYMFI
jgi:hypothetical protein